MYIYICIHVCVCCLFKLNNQNDVDIHVRNILQALSSFTGEIPPGAEGLALFIPTLKHKARIKQHPPSTNTSNGNSNSNSNNNNNNSNYY